MVSRELLLRQQKRRGGVNILRRQVKKMGRRWIVAVLIFVIIGGLVTYGFLRGSGTVGTPAEVEKALWAPPFEWRSVVNVDLQTFQSYCQSGEISRTFIERHGDTYVTIEYLGLSASGEQIYRTTLKAGGYYDYEATTSEKTHPIVVRWVRLGLTSFNSLFNWGVSIGIGILLGLIAGVGWYYGLFSKEGDEE